MIRIALIILAIVVAGIFLAFPSSAARLPLDAMVKVVDLPDTPEFQREDGTYVDLGYKHTVWGEGSWIGYLGHNSYLEFTTDQARMVAAAGGLSDLPDVPPVPFEIRLVQGVGLIGIAGFVLSFFRRSPGQRRKTSSAALERYAEILADEMPAERELPRMSEPAPQRMEAPRAAMHRGEPRKAFGRR